jgi:hypothetical protein
LSRKLVEAAEQSEFLRALEIESELDRAEQDYMERAEWAVFIN